MHSHCPVKDDMYGRNLQTVMFSRNTLMKIAIVLDEEKQISLPKARRYWVHPILRQRKRKGEFSTLYKELIDDETKFHRYFRMSPNEFHQLHEILKSDLTKQNTTFRESISSLEKLAVCLRFLATGDSFQTISFSYRLGHSTVHAIVQEVCNAVIRKLLAVCIPTPRRKDWEKTAEQFWTTWNFPNCLGALDGKHIEITAPSNSGSNYFNYKKTFSVVLLALVDADYKFIAVDIGSYGKNSDGGIFSTSRLGKSLNNGTLDIPDCKNLPGTNIEAPYVIVGDSAFPLKANLLRPYPELQVQGDVEKRIFNYRLCRARRVVENAFGILAQRFRLYFRKINSKPNYIENIILTTCILHNFLRNGTSVLSESSYSSEQNQPIFMALPGIGNNARLEAFQVREKFTAFFNSEVGSVSWQNDKI